MFLFIACSIVLIAAALTGNLVKLGALVMMGVLLFLFH